MPLPSTSYNRRVTFYRRPPISKIPDESRPTFQQHGVTQWAWWREQGRPRDVMIGTLPLQLKAGEMKLRANSFTRDISASDRVDGLGTFFEVISTIEADGDIRIEMQEAPTRQVYERAFDLRGEAMTIVRGFDPAPVTRVQVRGIVKGYEPSELVGGIMQGERQIFIFAADVEGTPLGGEVRSNDRITFRGRTLNIVEVDRDTHTVAGVRNAFQVRAKGG